MMIVSWERSIPMLCGRNLVVVVLVAVYVAVNGPDDVAA